MQELVLKDSCSRKSSIANNLFRDKAKLTIEMLCHNIAQPSSVCEGVVNKGKMELKNRTKISGRDRLVWSAASVQHRALPGI